MSKKRCLSNSCSLRWELEWEVTFCCLSSSVKALRNVDEVRLSCCVLTYLDCSHQVTWLFNQVQVVERSNLKILRSSCSATVKTLTSHVYYRSRKEFLTCEIRNKSNQTVQFSFRPSGEKHCQESVEAQNLDFTSLTQGGSQQQQQLKQQQQQLGQPEEPRTQQHSEVDVMSRCSFRKAHHCSCFELITLSQYYLWCHHL